MLSTATIQQLSIYTEYWQCIRDEMLRMSRAVPKGVLGGGGRGYHPPNKNTSRQSDLFHYSLGDLILLTENKYYIFRNTVYTRIKFTNKIYCLLYNKKYYLYIYN
jgi:hypothetical protein